MTAILGVALEFVRKDDFAICRRLLMSSHFSNMGRTRPRRALVAINLAIALVHAREMDDLPTFPCSILWLNCERGFLRALPSWSLGGRRIVSLALYPRSTECRCAGHADCRRLRFNWK